MGRWVLHVDLDQFIAAVEVLRRPELRGLPVVVGGRRRPDQARRRRTASYEARAFGVQSGMPLRTAARRIPDAVFLPVDKPAYEAASAEVMAALREHRRGRRGARLGRGVPRRRAPTTRRRSPARSSGAVREATRLECSVGIGQNKLQAKIATGFGKPAGVFRITGDTWFDLLGDRAAGRAVGHRTADRGKLEAEGITHRRATWPPPIPARSRPLRPDHRAVAGPASGRASTTPRSYGGTYVPKSRSREVTFQQDLDDWDVVRAETARVAGLVAEDVAAEGRRVVRVVVKIRWVPFTTQTHGVPLAEPVTDADALAAAALAALDGFERRRKVRLLGVRAEFE